MGLCLLHKECHDCIFPILELPDSSLHINYILHSTIYKSLKRPQSLMEELNQTMKQVFLISSYVMHI